MRERALVLRERPLPIAITGQGVARRDALVIAIGGEVSGEPIDRNADQYSFNAYRRQNTAGSHVPEEPAKPLRVTRSVVIVATRVADAVELAPTPQYIGVPNELACVGSVPEIENAREGIVWSLVK